MTVVSIRAGHGGGKSSIVRQILKKYSANPVDQHSRALGISQRPYGYEMILPDESVLFVVGPYLTDCGGCDGIQPYADIWPRVLKAHNLGYHVLFEGALVSSSYGSMGAQSEELGDEMIFAFLDTPLDKCIERVNTRRAGRGKGPIADTTNIQDKFRAVARSRIKIDETYGRCCIDIDHTRPVQQIMKLFGVTIRKEPPR